MKFELFKQKTLWFDDTQNYSLCFKHAGVIICSFIFQHKAFPFKSPSVLLILLSSDTLNFDYTLFC